MDKDKIQLAEIGVVITGFERLSHTIACLNAVLSTGIRPNQIVFVDGGSANSTITELKALFPQIKLISGLGNLWWAEGMNVGLQHALGQKYSWILLLNQDCIVASDMLTTLLATGREHSEAAVFASVVLDSNQPERVIDGGNRWKRHRKYPGVWVIERIYPSGTHYAELPSQPFAVEIFTGRGVLVRRQIFEKVGLYDTAHFPQRGSDDDLSLRVNQAGLKILIVPTAHSFTGTQDCGAERRPQAFWKHLQWSLFHPIGGQGLTVHFWLVVKHCPLYCILPTYFYRITNLINLAWRQSHTPA